MPKAGPHGIVGQSASDRQLQAALAQWEAFEAGFQRSKRGNLWRHWEG